MKKIILALLMLTALYPAILAAPRITFNDLLNNAEQNPVIWRNARNEAIRQNLPVNILTHDRVMIDAKGIEDGKVVYAVITNFADIYNGAYTLYYDEVITRFDLGLSRIDYGNGNVVDNTGGIYEPVYTSRAAVDRFLMIPEWTDDKVYLLDAQTGDLVDANFIPTTAPQLQSPKHALLHFAGRHILVSDQLSDVVQKFDTNGTYIGYYAPSSGPNTNILDNVRGIAYRPNKNLLVTVASSGSANTIQQFDSGGVHIGTFISSGLNSPFDILIRANDILVTNSSGSNKITKYDLNGTFVSNFYTQTNINFPQQMFMLSNGLIAVSGFSTPNSGLSILDADGNYIKTLTGITGNRGVYLLGNGHYLVTNGAGVHEIDSASGNLIRTITTAANLQYISPYNPGALLSNGNSGNITPDNYILEQNYPNPFNPSTSIKYSIPAAGLVKITVYDMNGKEIAVLVNEVKTAGSYEVTFNAAGLASGAYFYKLETDGFTDYKKMVLVK